MPPARVPRRQIPVRGPPGFRWRSTRAARDDEVRRCARHETRKPGITRHGHRRIETRLDRHRPHGLRDGGAPREGAAPTSPCGTARARRRSRLRQHGAKIAGTLADLAGCDIVFVMVSTWDDVKEVVAGPGGLLSGGNAPKLVVECSSISLEGSAELRATLAARGVEMLAAPVSGNAKVIKAGRLSFVCSGPRAAFDTALPYLRMIAPCRELRGRGRARAHREDLPQRVPRRGHAVARRDHGARAEGRRAAARVPRFHEPERDGLDVLALQDAGVREPRLQGDVHADSCCARTSISGSTRRAASRCRCRSRRSRATSCRR